MHNYDYYSIIVERTIPTPRDDGAVCHFVTQKRREISSCLPRDCMHNYIIIIISTRDCSHSILTWHGRPL